jgi:hypothetical protein
MRLVAAVLVALVTQSASSAASPKPSSTEDAQFRRWVIHDLKTGYREDPDFRNLVYGYALVDLNGDGRNEAVVWARDANCGTGGCDLRIFVRRKSGWKRISYFTLTRPPIKVLRTRSHGWLDLSSWQAGGGIRRPYEAPIRFNGFKYGDVEPKDPFGLKPHPMIRGRVIIDDATIPLFPDECHRTKESPSVFGPIPIQSAKQGSC